MIRWVLLAAGAAYIAAHIAVWPSRAAIERMDTRDQLDCCVCWECRQRAFTPVPKPEPKPPPVKPPTVLSTRFMFPLCWSGHTLKWERCPNYFAPVWVRYCEGPLSFADCLADPPIPLDNSSLCMLYDLNADGRVDAIDVEVFRGPYQEPCPGAPGGFDHGDFRRCMMGPGYTPPVGQCTMPGGYDYDADRDVDLQDWAFCQNLVGKETVRP